MIQHLAIIMDGNGRWAQQQNKVAIDGYRHGAKNAFQILKHISEKNIPYVTLYTFSHENWQRSKPWLAAFFQLMEFFLFSEEKRIIASDWRIRFIGDLSKLPEKLQRMCADMEQKTATARGMTVLVAFGYGGRQEIVAACQKISQAGLEVTEANINKFLYTNNVPDPDLLIRTSGEQRISNFLLWQMAYTEFVFHPKLWPDFSLDDLDFCINEFFNRKRRYGKEIAA